MKKLLFLLAFVFLCLPAQKASADGPSSNSPGSKPPEIIQKYLTAIQQASTLAAAITRIDDNSDPDSAYIACRQPNQCKMVSRVAGLVVATLVSNGKSLYQWNDTLYFKKEAPSRLTDISPQMPFGQSALIGDELLSHPAYVSGISDWQDHGTVVLDKVPTRKVVSAKSQATLWLAAASGLPMQFSVAEGTGLATFRFRYTGLGSPVTNSDFETLPPDGVKWYQPPHDAALLPPGTSAPDFTLSTLNGTSVTLSKLKGQCVLVDFWASWCPPCRESMPHVQKIYDDLAQHGLTVLSVNTSDEQADMQTFLAAHPDYTTTMLFDPNRKPLEVGDRYRVTGIPTVYLIDPDGKVAASFVGYDSKEEAEIRFALGYLGVK